MKRFLVVILVLAFVLSLAACATLTQQTPVADSAKETSAEVVEEVPKAEPAKPVKIATLAGPTGMGLIGLINDETGAYSIEILTQPDQISPKIINGEVDIATIPSNLAAVLYNKMGGGLKVIAVNTTGVLYLLSSDPSVTSITDISGKDVVLTGQGATSEYIYNKVLAENNIVPNTTYLSAHADLSNAMAAGDIVTGLLPEPFVSITLAKNSELNVVVDYNEEWRKIFGESVDIPMGVAVVSDKFIEENPEALAKFIADYQASVAYVNSDMDSAAQDIEDAGLLPKAAIAKLAIPRCGISFIMGDDAKAMLVDFFDVLNDSNPKSIGGSLPDEAFYYKQ